MGKYIILGFRNAGLFRKNRNTKDKMFDIHGRKERKNSQEFIEPITAYQISGMLHVLFGERPKPSHRETVYESIPYLFDKSMESYLKIDSYKDDKGRFHSETIQLKKSIGNSWATQSFMYWERVKKLLEDEEIIKFFIDTLNDVFKCNVEEIPFNKVIEMIKSTKDSKIDDLFIYLASKKKSKIYSSIYGEGNQLSDINKDSRTQLTVLSGLDKINRLNGEIIVPVTDEDIIKIKSNKGCATLLDGGLVFIKDIKTDNTLSINKLNEFIQVKNISLEKQ